MKASREPLDRSPDPSFGPGERGFSLMEVIVATVIAVIAVMGLAHSFAVGRALIDRHENGRDALGLVQERLEYLLGVSPGNPDLAIGTHNFGIVALNPAVNGNETWTVVWVDDPIDGSGGGDLDGTDDYKRVTVTIAWSVAGMADQVQLSRIRLKQ